MNQPINKNDQASHDSKNEGHEGEVKIKSSVVSPPEPTPHPKDYEAIEY